MSKTLINIMGAGRSGTTMLDLILGNDEESYSLGEVHAWFRPFRQHHFTIDCCCGDPNCEYWNRVKECKESEFHKKAFEEFNVDYLVDSSKNLTWMIDSHCWAQKYGIEIINFLIYKSVTNYCHSIWKRGESIQDAIYRYKLYYRRFFDSGLPAYALNYQELIQEPDKTLQELCKITGQRFYENRKEFWNKEHHYLFGSEGIRKQVRRGDSKIKVRKEFSEEFKSLIPEIESIVGEDEELNVLFKKLKRYDYKNKKQKYNGKQITKIKPLWYYYLKLKNKYRTVFPA